jgi:hypothetical protein
MPGTLRGLYPPINTPKPVWARGRQQGRSARAIETMIGWDPVRVILAHGRRYDHDDAIELRRAFRGLLC